MQSLKRAILYGFLVWLIPFLAAVFIFPIHTSNRPLFESVMTIVLCGTTFFFAKRYYRQIERYYVAEGVRLGIMWIITSLVIDFPFFITGPFKMTPIQYISDIGIAYLIFPIITIGLGQVISSKK